MLSRRVLLSALGFMVLVLLLGGGRHAQAGPGPILYASTGDANSDGGGRLYTIDPVAQTVTLIGNTGLSKLGALAFDGNGVLYGADGGSVRAILLVCDQYKQCSGNAHWCPERCPGSGCPGV